MKKIIRIKVKHVLAGIGISLALLLLTYTFIPSIILYMGERYNQNGEPMAAKIYYDRLDRFFPNRAETATALERLAEISDTNSLLMISSAGTGSVQGMTVELSKESQEYYEKLVERFPQTWQGRSAQTQLSKQNIRNLLSKGRVDEAFEIMVSHYETINAIPRTNYYDSSVALGATQILKSQGLYNEALRFSNYLLEERDYSFDQRLYQSMAELHALLGNQEQAEEYYLKLLDLIEEGRQREAEFAQQEGNDAISERSYYDNQREVILRRIASLGDKPLQYGKITGSLTLMDSALASIQFFLQEQNDPSRGVIFGGHYEDSIWSITDSSGNFSFGKLPPGRYSLGFILDLDEVGDVILEGGFFPESTIYIDENQNYHWDFNLVDTLRATSPVDNEKIIGDQVHFKWEPFEGAAYYTLEMGSYSSDGSGWISTIYSDKKFHNNEAILSLEELTYTQTGMSYDSEGPTPSSLFGFAQPGGKYFWGVRAHDKNGSILTSTRGYLRSQNTDFHFEERDLRNGDELILARDYQGAIDAYEEDLSYDPEDAYALAMLGKLYGISFNIQEFSYPHADFNKALDYYERLYALTENPSSLDRIADISYSNLQDYEKTLEVLGFIETNYDLNSWQQSYRVRIQAHHGNYRESLDELLTIDHPHSDLEAALRIINNDFTDLTPRDKNSNDLMKEAWVDALNSYGENYASMDANLRNNLLLRSPLEAIEYIGNGNPPPHQALLKLCLEIIEPSITVDTFQEVKDFDDQYGSLDPELSKMLQRLLMTRIY
ncbi:hypothetical protein Amet_2147 [Alkaliphilus metalliredigens QYMF]|uniref:Uncharacterized protein n=1 Tax=Alkaliphilus metalliredigens (strain QYMF) TaxID=293826 RepID=A6TQ38_ALKMQ|nr:carboxypeptidase-like regulatory domain-containing protein [Alkaliphilus metalliredigens]ABR48306.1 hypothetical protein Amet_2147 [Alkaliphilus metalliredigens QYMF]